MEQYNIFPTAAVTQLKAGQLLIAEPLLIDPNYSAFCDPALRAQQRWLRWLRFEPDYGNLVR